MRGMDKAPAHLLHQLVRHQLLRPSGSQQAQQAPRRGRRRRSGAAERRARIHGLRRLRAGQVRGCIPRAPTAGAHPRAAHVSSRGGAVALMPAHL
jgi:hypothetical protein